MEAKKLMRPDTQPFQLSLRIRHPSLDPVGLSRELGIEAEHSFRAGERRSRSSAVPASVYTESYWLGALNPATWPLIPTLPEDDPRLQVMREGLGATATRSLGWALTACTRYLSAHGATLRRICAEGGQVSLLVTQPAEEKSSFQITPEASRVFSELGVTVEFEFASD